MDIKKCKFCRKNFQGLSGLCPSCVQELDDKYVVLRNHLDERPSSTLRELTEDTGIDERSILFLVREGRLILKAASTDIKCIKCGAAIISGRYCDACKSDIMHTLSSNARPQAGTAAKPAQPEASARPQQNSGLRGDDDKVQLHTRSSR